jgi:hypothetical protein
VWYAQQVELLRKDVVNVTIPLLGATWYREELRRRYSLVDSAFVAKWHGVSATVADICRRAHAQRRPVVVRAGPAIDAVPQDCN